MESAGDKVPAWEGVLDRNMVDKIEWESQNYFGQIEEACIGTVVMELIEIIIYMLKTHDVSSL